MSAKLVGRTPKGVDLTAVGSALLAHVQPLRLSLRDVAREAGDLSQGRAGHLRLGSGPTMAEDLLPAAYTALAKQSPKVTLTSNPEHGAASGIHFAKVLERLGVAEEMKSKTVFVPKPGPVGIRVADGKAEIAVHQLQELIPVGGIEILGRLPNELQDTLVFAAAIMKGTNDAAASRALVNFLGSPEAAAVIKAKGMEPG